MTTVAASVSIPIDGSGAGTTYASPATMGSAQPPVDASVPSTTTPAVVIPPADAVVSPVATSAPVAESPPSASAPASPVAPAPPACDQDPSGYYYHYAPDVRAAGVDAFAHWNSSGYSEGRKSCWPVPSDSLYSNGKTTLRPGDVMISADKRWRMIMQGDGNLVGYDNSGKAFWSSKSSGKGQAPHQLVMQGDGNLVIYDALGKATWNIGKNSKNAPFRAIIQGDRNFVVYEATGKALWSSSSNE